MPRPQAAILPSFGSTRSSSRFSLVLMLLAALSVKIGQQSAPPQTEAKAHTPAST